MKSTKSAKNSDTKLLIPLAVLGGLVGFFILIGFSYDLFKRNSSNVTGKIANLSLTIFIQGGYRVSQQNTSVVD